MTRHDSKTVSRLGAVASALAVTLTLTGGCVSDTVKNEVRKESANCELSQVFETPSPPNKSSNRYVSFSGGGWRAHTAHTAFLIGLLDNQAQDTGEVTTLDEAFENVSATTSNSGGSWFNVMLGYSDTFRAPLEARGAPDGYLTDPNGYYANFKMLVTKADVGRRSRYVNDVCRFIGKHAYIGEFICEDGVDWRDLVHDYVFGPLDLNRELACTRFTDPQAWEGSGAGARKDIVVAATLLPTKTTLGPEKRGLSYYDAIGVDPSGSAAFDVTPVSLSSLAAGRVPAFPGSQPEVTLTYTHGKGRKDASRRFVTAKVDTSGMDIMSAATASSAAAGFVASAAISENNTTFLDGWFKFFDPYKLASELRDLAPLFELGETGESLRISNTSARGDDAFHRDRAFLRLADGGPLDNSGVAHAVLYHQKTRGRDVPFEIVSFNGTQQGFVYAEPGGEEGAIVSLDIAGLFGKGFTKRSTKYGERDGFCTDGYCINVGNPEMSPQVFETAALLSKAEWAYTVPTTERSPKVCSLYYTPYKVTTVDNAIFGIVEGTTGTLHAFSAICPDAGTAPNFPAYEQLFGGIQAGLSTNQLAGKEDGLHYLRRAFGLDGYQSGNASR